MNARCTREIRCLSRVVGSVTGAATGARPLLLSPASEASLASGFLRATTFVQMPHDGFNGARYGDVALFATAPLPESRTGRGREIKARAHEARVRIFWWSHNTSRTRLPDPGHPEY